jgi:hypothetical protein
MKKMTKSQKKVKVLKKELIMMNYKKSKPVQIPSENLIVDPRSETSIRGKNYIATGDKTTVKGTGKARKQKATWY